MLAAFHSKLPFFFIWTKMETIHQVSQTNFHDLYKNFKEGQMYGTLT